MSSKVEKKVRRVIIIIGVILLAFIVFIVGHIQAVLRGHQCRFGLTLSQETALTCLITAVILLIPIIIYLIYQVLKIEQLEQAVDTDDLTGLFNRRSIEKIFALQMGRYKRYGEYFAIVFIDLNNFKNINDRWGHDFGDAVLAEVAQKILQNIRTVDIPVRYGGDEFVIIMPQADYHGAMMVLKRLQSEINADLLSYPEETVDLGISGGVAVFPEDGKDITQLIKIADGRMYSEKRINKTASISYR